MNQERIRHNLDEVLGRIAEAARRSGRHADAVRLVAVTKKSPPDWIRPLVDLRSPRPRRKLPPGALEEGRSSRRPR